MKRLTFDRRLVLSLAGAILVAAVMTLYLALEITSRAAILADGRPVMLAIRPVDPRDLLRGEYVALSPEIDRVPVSLVRGAVPEGEERSLWVRLRVPSDGGAATVAEAAFEALPPEEGTVVIRSLPFEPSPAVPATGTYRVRYGIERFYLPEGEGKKVEQAAAAKPMSLLVKVADDGEAQAEALFIDGKPVYSLTPQ